MPGRAFQALTGAGGSPATITVHEAADEQAEAAWIAGAIDRLLGGASFHSLDSGRADGHAADGLALADITVLYRTDAQAGPLGQALTGPACRSRNARMTSCSAGRRCPRSSVSCVWPPQPARRWRCG